MARQTKADINYLRDRCEESFLILLLVDPRKLREYALPVAVFSDKEVRRPFIGAELLAHKLPFADSKPGHHRRTSVETDIWVA